MGCAAAAASTVTALARGRWTPRDGRWACASRAHATRRNARALAANGPPPTTAGEDGERPGAADAAPLRSTIPEGGLKIERLLDTLSGDTDGTMSNRAKFRALPIDHGIMGRIKKYSLSTNASTAGRTTRVLRNRNEISEVTQRYAMYDVGMLEVKTQRLLGLGRSKRTAKFIAAAAREGEEPPKHAVGKGASKIKDDVPEIAFAGRSNVGKSSLINALTLSSVARSSDVPGKTQSLNFYSMDERIRLVDLPGYGFAFAKQHRVESWNELMDKYLTSRPNLKRVYLVIDARHGMKASDREMLAFLSKYGETQCGVILNKCDYVNPNELARRAYLIQEELRYTKRARTMVLMASTSTGAGVTEIAREIYGMALDDPSGEEYDDDDDDDVESESDGDYVDVDVEDDDSFAGSLSKKTEFYGGEWKPGQKASKKYTPASKAMPAAGRGGRGGRGRGAQGGRGGPGGRGGRGRGGRGRGGGRSGGRGRGKGFTQGTPGSN